MARKSKRHGPKNRFYGNGPFRKINKLTTQVRDIEAVKRFGLGGDALNDAIDRSENPEFIEGVINAHKYLQ